MKKSPLLLIALGAGMIFGATGLAHAQGGPNSGMNPAMLKMFGDVKGFSAKADLRVLQTGQKEIMSGTVGFDFLDGQTRMEMDLTKMKSAQIPPEVIAQLKQMGMDINIVLNLPDKKVTLLVYPSLAIAWKATDQKDLPIQVEISEQQGTTAIMRYKDIKLAKPDAKLFDAPADYKKYTNQQEMMQTEGLKRLGGK